MENHPESNYECIQDLSITELIETKDLNRGDSCVVGRCDRELRVKLRMAGEAVESLIAPIGMAERTRTHIASQMARRAFQTQIIESLGVLRNHQEALEG